ncbi:MAG: IS200/IS605 family transposase [Bacteroidales bacterium]|jgi:REP element-mobilizing transposase RayT|nr:IS200/IS605 family transposase [Bacteroidales bacterium]
MSYVNLLIHAIVRTYKSELTLPTDDRIKFLYQEMWGIIKNKGGYLYRINAMPDHVHLLFTMPPTISLSEFMQALKGSSSKIIKTKDGFENFKAWGEGYAALSKSVEDKQKIINYIINQQEHHKTEPFKKEYTAFVEEMGLAFDERDWER